MLNPQRHLKTGVFRLRKAVPPELRRPVAAILGRNGAVRELLRTLETRDPREAKARMADAVAWADGVLEAARIGAQPVTNKQTFALAGI
jgi:hypothetical protein